MSCKRPTLIKNKFISTLIATCGILFGISYVFPMSAFSVYLTSYIHEKQDFVTMHYGFFMNLIYAFSMTFGMSLGGILELKLGFILTTLSGLLIILIANLFFLNVQNIWFCYALTFFIASGAGIANSLTGKNLAFYKPDKKGLLISGMMAITILFGGGFSLFGEKLINPDGYTLKWDEEYYKYEYSSRTYIYFTFGFFSIPIGTIIFLLLIVEYKKNKSEALKEEESDKKEETNEENNIKNTEKDYENEIDNNKNEEGDIIIEKELKTMNKKRNLKKIIKTLRFWRLSFIQFLITFSFSFILGTGRTFGALIGIDGRVLQFLMLLQSFALVLVGPILGIFVDKKGPLNLLRIGSLLCMIPGLLLTFFTRNTFVFTVSFVISVLALITVIVCFAPFIMEVYGIQESVIIGGVMNVFSKLSEIITTVGAFVISLFYSKDEIIRPYQIMYITGAVCCLLSFVLLMFESMEKYNYKEDDEDLGNLVENGRFTEALKENA